MENLLSVKQVAFMLRVHPLTVRRYIANQRLKAVRVGGNVRIEEKALQDFQKDVETPEPTTRIFKTTRSLDKQFTRDDPFLRLEGRGAGIKLEK